MIQKLPIKRIYIPILNAEKSFEPSNKLVDVECIWSALIWMGARKN